MTRPRDKKSSMGLLPRMEARTRKDGLITYRYHPIGANPINLGTDRAAAIRQVLDLNDAAPDRATVAGLWRRYQEATEWTRLAENTRIDYRQCSKALLKVFGSMNPADVTPAYCARYLRIERKEGPKRANREMALMSNLMNLAIEDGEVLANPCKQVRRNPEQPRKEAPEPQTLIDFLAWARAKKGQAIVMACMAEFAALTGNRRTEFLNLRWDQVDSDVVKMQRAKQRGREVVEAVAISPALAALLDTLRGMASNAELGAVFATKAGNAYTEAGFKAMWSKLTREAFDTGVITKRFTFHDLRAYHATQHKRLRGALPDLHANTATTARVYDRTKQVNRDSL